MNQKHQEISMVIMPDTCASEDTMMIPKNKDWIIYFNLK